MYLLSLSTFVSQLFLFLVAFWCCWRKTSAFSTIFSNLSISFSSETGPDELISLHCFFLCFSISRWYLSLTDFYVVEKFSSGIILRSSETIIQLAPLPMVLLLNWYGFINSISWQKYTFCGSLHRIGILN